MRLQHRRIRATTVILALAALAWVWLPGQASAQLTTGSIYGAVTDQTGGVIPNADVTVTNTQTGETHKARSNDSGNYVFPALVPSDYTASAQVAGFSAEAQNGIHLSANQNVLVSFLLRPGSTTETVTVTASTTLVDTLESQIGITVDEKRIDDLPLNGRNAYDLISLVPGVNSVTTDSPIGDQYGTTFNVNGNRPDQDSYYLDGAFDIGIYNTSGNLIPNPDALQEFRLLTSDFDAEYGRSPGGVVNVITKSGTNAYHGLFYDYLRNNVLNAKSYFNTSVTPLKQNQFGTNFGGPIVHSRAFFFASYQGWRLATPVIVASSALTTLTAAEAKGDFSAAKQTLWPKQANGAYYSCNGVQGVICPNLLDPVAQNLLKYIPLENPTPLLPPQQSGSGNLTADQGLGRVDYQLNSSHKLSAMFFTSRGTSGNPTQGSNAIMDYSGQIAVENQTNAVIGDSWVVSPSKLNDLRLFYTLNHFNGEDMFNGKPSWADLGSQVAVGSAYANITQPRIIINGYFTMGVGGAAIDNNYQQTIGASDTFNWTRGNHTIKLGGAFIFNPYKETGNYFEAGLATFSGYLTKNAMADFLLGSAVSFRQNDGFYQRLHSTRPSLFAQDDWRITRRLSLNLGLRWELFSPFVGLQNFGTFRPNVQSTRFPTAPLGLLAVGDAGIPDGIMPTQWAKFAPRVGFAYDVFGNGTTSLRGGFGVFYATRSVTVIDNMQQQPFVRDLTVSNTPNLINPYGSGPNPFPFKFDPKNPVFLSGATIQSIPPGASWPYVYEYNLTLERQLSVNWGAHISYVGSVGHKFYLARDQNAPVYSPGASTSTAGLNARRPYQPTPSTYTFAQICENDPAGNSSYNSLQATLTRRFAHSFSLSSSYVWSKSLDIQSADAANSTLVLSNQNDPRMDRGPSDYNIPQRFIASYIWAAPSVRSLGVFGRQVLSGWQINGVTTLSKGKPFNVTSGVDSNLDGTSTDRPNVIGNPVISGIGRAAKIKEFFNTAAFAQVPAGVPFGNVTRNSLVGPGTVNTDASAFKDFPVFDKGTLQFRAELFNIFNNVNLSNPTASLTSPKFGQIGGSGSPRIVQFALRYSF